QHGFALLELALAVLIATLFAIFAADQFAQRGRDLMAEGHAVWMKSLRQATQRYLELHMQTLIEQGSAAQVAGFTHAYAPTPAELKAAGLLSAGFAVQGVRG